MARLVRHLHKQNRLSRGLAATWTAQNPVLFEGEMGWETDTERVKIGDGVSDWVTLGYAFEAGGGVTDHGDLTGLGDDDHTAYATNVELTAHIDDTSDAHDASAVSVDSTTLVGVGTTVQAVFEELDDAIASIVALDFLVGTATGVLSGEIVAGTTPGGELGGTWASPTVDATHSGSTHSAATDTHIADTTDAHDASAISADSTTLVGTGTDVQAVLEELDNAIVDHAAAADPHTGYLRESVLSEANAVDLTDGGETVLHSHAGSGAEIAVKESNAAVGDATALDFGTGFDLTFAGGEAEIGIDLSELDHGALGGLTDDDHTQYRLESADHTHQSTGLQGGTLDHGLALTGLTDDDHTQYWKETDIAAKGDLPAGTANDTVGILTVGANGLFLRAASGEATGLEWFDHAGAADPHTGYRLESADHTHQSTGAQAGTLDHGLALTGLTDDDHTQYVLESEFAAVGDLLVGSGAGTLDNLGKGTTGQHLITDTGETLDLKWESQTLTIGAVFNGSAVAVGTYVLWRAPVACTVTAVRGYVDTGTTTVINAQKVGTGDFCSSDITIDPADAWEAGTVNQNTALSAGDTVAVEIVTAGTATQLTIQVEVTRP